MKDAPCAAAATKAIGILAFALFGVIFSPTLARAEKITMYVGDPCGRPLSVFRAITEETGDSFSFAADGTVSLDVPAGTRVGITSYSGSNAIPPDVISGPWVPAQNDGVLPTKCPDGTPPAITMHVGNLCGQPARAFRVEEQQSASTVGRVAPDGTATAYVAAGTQVAATNYWGSVPAPANAISSPWVPAQNGGALPTRCP